MVWLGVGEVLGGQLIGLIIDRFGSKRSTLFNILIISAMSTVTILNLDLKEVGYLAYLMCFLWGF